MHSNVINVCLSNLHFNLFNSQHEYSLMFDEKLYKKMCNYMKSIELNMIPKISNLKILKNCQQTFKNGSP